MSRLYAFLTADEFDALEQVDEGRYRTILNDAKERLITLGYVHESDAGLEITSSGRMRLALGL